MRHHLLPLTEVRLRVWVRVRVRVLTLWPDPLTLNPTPTPNQARRPSASSPTRSTPAATTCGLASRCLGTRRWRAGRTRRSSSAVARPPSSTAYAASTRVARCCASALAPTPTPIPTPTLAKTLILALSLALALALALTRCCASAGRPSVRTPHSPGSAGSSRTRRARRVRTAPPYNPHPHPHPQIGRAAGRERVFKVV